MQFLLIAALIFWSDPSQASLRDCLFGAIQSDGFDIVAWQREKATSRTNDQTKLIELISRNTEKRSREDIVKTVSAYIKVDFNEPIWISRWSKEPTHSKYLFTSDKGYTSEGAYVEASDAMAGFFYAYQRHPSLVDSSHGALHFHGSSASSLLTFMDATPDRGKIWALNHLKKAKGQVPFGGEVLFGWSQMTGEFVSVVDLRFLDSALSYAYNGSRKPWTPLASFRKRAEVAFQQLTTRKLSRLGKQWIESTSEVEKIRYAQWKKLSKEEKALVKRAFPVVYGFRLSPHRPAITMGPIYSDISGEIGVLRSIYPEEMRVIYVPHAEVDYVRSLLGDLKDSIAVEPIEVLGYPRKN